jgi:hypothetical protein
VESATTAHVPARTGAVEAYKTTSLLVACTKTGDTPAHTARIAIEYAMKQRFLRFCTCFSRQSGFLASSFGLQMLLEGG